MFDGYGLLFYYVDVVEYVGWMQIGYGVVGVGDVEVFVVYVGYVVYVVVLGLQFGQYCFDEVFVLYDDVVVQEQYYWIEWQGLDGLGYVGVVMDVVVLDVQCDVFEWCDCGVDGFDMFVVGVVYDMYGVWVEVLQ